MTAKAANAAVQPGPAKSPAPMAHLPWQHRRSGHTRRGSRAPARTDAHPMRDDLMVAALVTRARDGDKQAWDALVERYAPLLWSICRRHRLGGADAADVGQSVWLHLVDQLDHLRDPAALPGWLATTTRRECGRILRGARGPDTARSAVDAETVPDERAGTVEQDLLVAERHAALREAFTHLPPDGQQLIALLIADPPVPYAEISARLGIPVGSIGPNRARCLDKMRRYPAIAALINAEAASAAGGQEGSKAAAARPPDRKSNQADLGLNRPCPAYSQVGEAAGKGRGKPWPATSSIRYGRNFHGIKHHVCAQGRDHGGGPHRRAGKFVQTGSSTGGTPDWTHVVAVSANILFVRNDGTMAVGHIDGAGVRADRQQHRRRPGLDARRGGGVMRCDSSLIFWRHRRPVAGTAGLPRHGREGCDGNARI